MDEQGKTFKEWCIVELFGHQRIAGLVSEQAVGGCNFIRVDVPQIGKRPALTRLFGQGAIYSMTPTTETLARRAAEAWNQPPVNRYELPEPPKRDGDLFVDGERDEDLDDPDPDDEEEPR